MPKHRGLPGRGFLRLGGLENSKNSASGSLRRRDLRLGFTPTHRRRGVEQKQKWPILAIFIETLSTKTEPTRNHYKTELNHPKTHL